MKYCLLLFTLGYFQLTIQWNVHRPNVPQLHVHPPNVHLAKCLSATCPSAKRLLAKCLATLSGSAIQNKFFHVSNIILYIYISKNWQNSILGLTLVPTMLNLGGATCITISIANYDLIELTLSLEQTKLVLCSKHDGRCKNEFVNNSYRNESILLMGHKVEREKHLSTDWHHCQHWWEQIVSWETQRT